ncbi:PREDICTED: uncharacterized protein LOC105146196 [Acromyrmex echinatior]|uniref:Uncharacterized protein n=1 Tax=Acromyrmex echinatior TaxID=103372 RepID=F4WKH4_ACREC|nr:PREDICTED: uncharacterized protein LOC105146196 [Acromyrmex echinatior]EGI65312.1 hypothetical protein G5I_06171 [Acromyrmex echinatior]
MEDKKATKKIDAKVAVAIDSDNQYAASYLKTGSTRGVVYQLKLLTWVAWKLMCQKDARISNWWLATEVRNARGFHDLVLKYAVNDIKEDGSISDKKYMYRFMQIKHKRSLTKNSNITSYHLLSQNKLHRQGSLIYLFKAYVNMLGSFEITPDQILDLTIFTNMNIEAFNFLVPEENDRLYGFEGKGKRYRIDIRELKKNPRIMVCLYNIKEDENIIFGFLRKLVFMVYQPSEHELEELIVADMGKTFNTPQIFFDNLYKNIINWFLIYDAGKAPYLTKDSIKEYLKKSEAVIKEVKNTEIFVNCPVLNLSNELQLLSL